MSRTRSRPAGNSRSRVDAVDAARGFAVAMMIAYHGCFDLTYFGWAGWRMLDEPGWIAWRDGIVASFVFLVGVSLALRDDRERGTARDRWLAAPFVRRWAEIAGAALLVTAGSYAIFPTRFIYFGVLHFVAVALWLCRRAPRSPATAAVLAVVALAVGVGCSAPAFDPKPFDWIGFATVKPLTEDYVPLFPWVGVTLAGCAAGGWWLRGARRAPSQVEAAWRALPHSLRTVLQAMGRHSLAIYLVHQPLLFGAMALVRQVRSG